MIKEFTTRDTSNSLLDDPNNYLADDLFDYIENNLLDFGNIDQAKNDIQNDQDVLDINFVPQPIQSSQTEENFDVYEYFAIYNDLYFQSRLGCVRLEWSKRMTTCAGIFYKKSFEYIIRLSEPLLKYRTIKEIKETLIHEMIHAWVQIENLDQSDDRSGHGYNFKLKMYEINKSTGFNITVYHSFHNEVDYHKKHVWRCNGSCKDKMPYYGYVKRAMNRAPGKYDRWWEDHKRSCGGEFIKVDEPKKISVELKENENSKLIVASNKDKNNLSNINKENKKKPSDLKKAHTNNKKIDEFLISNKKFD